MQRWQRLRQLERRRRRRRYRHFDRRRRCRCCSAETCHFCHPTDHRPFPPMVSERAAEQVDQFFSAIRKARLMHYCTAALLPEERRRFTGKRDGSEAYSWAVLLNTLHYRYSTTHRQSCPISHGSELHLGAGVGVGKISKSFPFPPLPRGTVTDCDEIQDAEIRAAHS